MKKMIVIVFVYLIGCVWCYRLAKDEISKRFHKYTVEDRMPCIMVSSTSWAGVIFFSIRKNVDFDAPAKW